MRVGVYVDGFNLYYGGKGLAGGSGVPGWRWLDPRRLVSDVVARTPRWVVDADIRVVYCTARISGRDNPGGQQDQDTYLRALVASGGVDVVAEGTYVARVASAPLATKDARGRPRIVTSGWPVMIKDANGAAVDDARFMVSVARREEKGSDVNVASHLLIDICTGVVDAAVVVSNDSDLAYPISWARERVPVGLVNPTKGYLAGALQGSRDTGPGGHWWYRLTLGDLRAAQLPTTVGALARPQGW